MKCLKSLLLVLLFSVAQLSMASGDHQKIKKEEKTCLSDTSKTIIVPVCEFDTIKLVGKGQKYKGKRYYYTNKECEVVEVNPPKNQKGVWVGFLSKLIRQIFRI